MSGHRYVAGITLALFVLTIGCKKDDGAARAAGEMKPKPPVAAPVATQTPRSLFERLGGEPAIRAVVDDFVAHTAANPKVRFTREGVEGARTWEATPENIQTLKQRLVEFIASAAGGPIEYKGQDMLTAHKGMKITNEEFNALASDLEASLKKFNVPDKERQELMTLAAGTRGAIVEEDQTPGE